MKPETRISSQRLARLELEAADDGRHYVYGCRRIRTPLFTAEGLR